METFLLMLHVSKEREVSVGENGEGIRLSVDTFHGDSDSITNRNIFIGSVSAFLVGTLGIFILLQFCGPYVLYFYFS